MKAGALVQELTKPITGYNSLTTALDQCSDRGLGEDLSTQVKNTLIFEDVSAFSAQCYASAMLHCQSSWHVVAMDTVVLCCAYKRWLSLVNRCNYNTATMQHRIVRIECLQAYPHICLYAGW